MMKTELKQLHLESADSGDRWGSAMSTFFDVAGELWWRGADIPAVWEYSPGAASDPREPDNYLFDYLENTDTDILIQFGNVLERYIRNLDRIGESY